MAVSKELPKNKKQLSKTIATTVKEEIEDFLQVTAVKSLQFAKRAAHWIESIFWITVLVGAMVLAIRDVRKACEDFANEETYTTMRVEGFERLTFNDAIICIEYDPHAVNLSNPQVIKHAEASHIVVDLAKRANTSAVELLNRMLKLITAISLIEHGRTADYQIKVADLQRTDDLQQLLSWLRNEAVDISDLRRLVGNWLCNAAQIEIITVKRGEPIFAANPCELEKISWLGTIPFESYRVSETAMCVDVGGHISFESMFDRVLIPLSLNTLFRSVAATNRSTNYVVNAYVDFSGNPVSTALTKDYFAFPASGCLSFEIGFGAISLALDRWKVHCNTTAKTRFPCYADCDVLTNTNARRWNCTLLAWRYLHAGNRTMCCDVLTFQEQVDGRRLAPRTNISGSCWKSCLFPCEYRQYDISLDPEGCYVDDANTAAERVSLELTPKRFRVPVFKEHFSPTLTELLSRIGGTCGLWLGVGLLGICHALLFPIKLLLKVLVQLSCSTQTNVAALELNEQA